MASIHEDGGARSPWVVRWREEGRQRSKRFHTRKAAERWRAATEDRLALGAHAPVQPARITLDGWLDQWLERYSIRWAMSTTLQRADLIDRHIRPHLGVVAMRDLGVARIATYQQGLAARGCSAKTVNACVRVLSACLGSAVREGLIPGNPCRGADPLPQQRADRRPIPLDIIEGIRAGMTLPRDRLVVSLMAYAGLRPGEVCGLTWRAVQDHTLHIHQAYSVADGVKGTKTGATRTVPIEAAVREDLDAVGRGSGLVVTGERGGPVHWRNWGRRIWVPARGATDFVPYECRHTFASLLIRSGADVMEVQDRLGHASARMTLDHYAHLLRDQRYARDVPLADLVADARRHARPLAAIATARDRPGSRGHGFEAARTSTDGGR